MLARDRFVGKRLVSALVDLPLAVSPVIVGLMAVLLFGRGGWFEPFFAARGIQVIFALPSMILVTIFISIPFVIREVVPVLQELGMEEEQAAWTLGASRLQTFRRVTLPNIRWGLLYGIALSAARSIGEVGAVLIVSGSLQGQTETATLYILRAFDQYQEQQAYIVALTLASVLDRDADRDRDVETQSIEGGGLGGGKHRGRGLTKSFGSFRAVDDVTFEAAEGTITALLGPSGSGKSTVLRMIAGLEQPDSGSVWVAGEELTEASVQDRRLGFVFQHYALFRHMTVRKNVAFGLSVRRVDKATQRERVDELLELVGLGPFGDRYPDQLSGGQRQRVALARALAPAAARCCCWTSRSAPSTRASARSCAPGSTSCTASWA